MHILAIDDDPVILDLLSLLIETEGEHSLEISISGLNSLELLQQDKAPKFDCFLPIAVGGPTWTI